MLKIFGFKVIGAVRQLLILDLSCQPDCSSKFKYMTFAGTPGLNELILKVGLVTHLGLGMVVFSELGLGCLCSAARFVSS